jgi:hypothetical protein
MSKKANLKHLRAAMVLALESSDANQTAIWWTGIAKNVEGEQCIVLQVPAEENTPAKASYLEKAVKVLSGYGIPRPPIVLGSSWHLLPISVDYLTDCLPERVTRKWLSEVDIEEGHNPWKREVVAQLDDLGIRYLKMNYSGAGDSANDDEWSCSRAGSDDWFPKDWQDESGTHWRKQAAHRIPEELATLISEYVWETLVQYDCVNNDGGGGDLTIDLTSDEPTFLFSCYTNEMVSTDHAKDEEV